MKPIWRGIRDSGVLASGSLASVALSLVASLYLARVLGPHDFGVYSVVTAYVATFAIVADLGLNQVALREAAAQEGRAEEMLQGLTGPKLLLGFGLYAAAAAALPFIGYATPTDVLILVAAVVLVPNGLSSLYAVVFNVRGGLGELAAARVAERGIFLLGAFVSVQAGSGVYGVVWASVASSLALFAYIVARGRLRYSVRFALRFLREHVLYRHALWFAAASALVFAVGRLNIFLASLYFPPEEVAYIAVPMTLVEAGATIVGSVMMAFFPYASRRLSSGTVPARVLARLTLAMLAIGVPVCVFGYVAAPFVVRTLYGETYAPAIPLLRILLWSFLLSLAHVPTSLAADVTYNQRLHIWIGSYTAVLNVVIVAILAPRLGLEGIALTSLGVRVVAFVTGVPLVIHILRRRGHLN